MIRGYARYRRTMLCAALAAVCVFPAVMLLCSLQVSFVAYAVLIYVFIILGFICFDVFRYWNKVARLSEIKENIGYTQHEYPSQENNIEQLYSGIIAELYKLMDSERSELVGAHSEQVDYYTMWLHQIKTPISAMRLAMDSVGEPNPVYEQELFKIERYVEMALQYVKARNIENDLCLETTKVDDVLRECIKKYKTPFIYKGLSMDFEPTGLVVITDRKWLSFIVEQLLSNAIKYTPSGGIKIYRAANGFVVEDTGIGIRSQDLPRIFEKGYTGLNGRLDNRASGLGLYMANTAAKELGITLAADSQLKKGTRMSVIFS